MSPFLKIPLSLRAAYLAMHRQTNAHLADLGITADQFVCLLVLYDRRGMIQKELAERATSDQNTVGAIVALLEKKGYVKRGEHRRDRRAWFVTITPKGRAVTERGSAALRKVHARVKSRISELEAGVLNALLGRLATTLLTTRTPGA